jgi:hypothetical protein
MLVPECELGESMPLRTFAIPVYIVCEMCEWFASFSEGHKHYANVRNH